MPFIKFSYWSMIYFLSTIALASIAPSLASIGRGDVKRVDLDNRHYYENEPAKSNDECLNSSSGINNCVSKTSEVDSTDRPYKLQYRLQQIDRVFDESEVPDALLEAEGASTTLRQVLLLHRHGDRTAVQFDAEDPLAKEPFWTFHGLGQLTNRGKARLYLLGKMMRRRYNKFLNGKVNKNERITRASGSLRCIESAQSFLASFLGLNESSINDARKLVWDRRANILAQIWQPVNILSVPGKLDAMLNEGAECQNLADEFENVIEKSAEAQSLYIDYKHEAEVLKTSIGREIHRFYMWMWAASLIEVEQSYFADKMKPELIDILPRLKEAGYKAMGLYASTVKARRLRSGVLMGDMIKNMIEFRDGGDQPDSKTKKFVHYSAHDLNIATVLNMLDAWKKFPTVPDYGANLVLELHQDHLSNGEWFLRIFYMSPVPSVPTEIHLPECESNHPKSRCTLEKFQTLMEPYTIASWQDWMKECNNDFTRLDPYGQAS